MIKTSRFALHLGAFALASIINPAYVVGCMAEVEDEQPDFGEPEMLELLASANQTGTWDFQSDGTTYQLELTLDQAVGEDQANQESARRAAPSALWPVAHACGNRTFRQSASACLTVTSMPVTGTLTLREGDAVVAMGAVSGEILVVGRTLGSAELSLHFEESQLNLRAEDAKTFELVDFYGTPHAGLELDFASDAS